MSRIKRGTVTKRRHKRILKQTKGFWGQRGNLLVRARDTLRRAFAFAFKSRRLRKRDMRALFITRIGAACKENGQSYSKFINGLKKSNVIINRKMLSQLAVYEPEAFSALLNLAKS